MDEEDLYKIEADGHFVKFYYRYRDPGMRNPYSEWSSKDVVQKSVLKIESRIGVSTIIMRRRLSDVGE